MMWFKCKHPARLLGVQAAETVEPAKGEFQKVTYHLYCCRCGEKVRISYAKLIGGVDKFLDNA